MYKIMSISITDTMVCFHLRDSLIVATNTFRNRTGTWQAT